MLFRGNAEAEIRRNLIRKGYIKGIIGLPANLFFGTGIPACIIVIDKENADTRHEIFMIDASAGYMKDGNKNRLRAQDIHKIIDVFNKQLEIPKYARKVLLEEIEKNDYNLNIPRYIDSQQAEDIQDIEAHLHGGIPNQDIDALQQYWVVLPGLRAGLFQPLRENYSQLSILNYQLKKTIFEYPEFVNFINSMNTLFDKWRKRSATRLKDLQVGFQPKLLIHDLAEDLLSHYSGKSLIDQYAVYQHLMDYWAETMQDDCYLIAADGWKVSTYRIIEKDKKGKEKDKGWACDLVPKLLVVNRYFVKEQKMVDKLITDLETVTTCMTELEEEHSGEEGVFSEFDKINKAEVTRRLKEIKDDKAAKDEAATLNEWLKLSNKEIDTKKQLKDAEADLDAKAYAQYSKLSEAEIKTLVVDDKWLVELGARIHGEMDRISQALTQRVKELVERYKTPLPQLTKRVAELEQKVNAHLEKMGFVL